MRAKNTPMPDPKLKENGLGQPRESAEYIESLARGLRVLRIFSTERRPMTLSDVAKATNLPRATARRILHTLVAAGYVEDDGRLFALTPQVLTLASSFLSSDPVVTVMQPLMDKLSARAREVCSLAMLDGDDAVFIARSSPARIFSSGIEIGYRLPAFYTSVGRVLLGRLSNDEVAEAIERIEPQRLTPFTVIDRQLLIAAIITDRSRGYSLVDQEAEEGFRSIAGPVLRYDGTIIAAINIGTHIDRISPGEMIDRFLPLLRETSDQARPLLV
jgi:IclR family transcriptional regulator, pca regulon regulatory protein